MKRLNWEKIRAFIKQCIPPDPYGFTWLDILRVCFGVDVLVMPIVLLNQYIGVLDGLMWVNAVFLVTALMTFLMPSSPMFHPKAIIEGNVVSALLASASVYIFPDSHAALILAVAASACAMYLLKCFHPVALMLALFIAAGKINSYIFAVFPVLVDSLLLVLIAYCYGMLTKHPYPAKDSGK